MDSLENYMYIFFKVLMLLELIGKNDYGKSALMIIFLSLNSMTADQYVTTQFKRNTTYKDRNMLNYVKSL